MKNRLCKIAAFGCLSARCRSVAGFNNSLAACSAFLSSSDSRSSHNRYCYRSPVTKPLSYTQFEASGYDCGNKNHFFSRIQSPRSNVILGSSGQLECRNTNNDNDGAQKLNTKNPQSENSAKVAFSHLAKHKRSWKRLRHLIEFAIAESSHHAKNPHQLHPAAKLQGIADVGTDHGLLAVGLAVTGHFAKVVGVDVSAQALDGALRLQASCLQPHTNSKMKSLSSLEFRQSNGLQSLRKGEADIVCVAGMGVHTMVEILTARNDSTNNLLLLDDLDCNCLILQPTSSKPRHLIQLFSTLNQIGWGLRSERIEYLSERWYLSLQFSRDVSVIDRMPGALLLQQACNNNNDADQQDVFHSWVAHHKKWIVSDSKKGPVPKEEAEWMQVFESL